MKTMKKIAESKTFLLIDCPGDCSIINTAADESVCSMLIKKAAANSIIISVNIPAMTAPVWIEDKNSAFNSGMAEAPEESDAAIPEREPVVSGIIMTDNEAAITAIL